ncbi:hypothetical protein KCU95_g1077, partial [Aureobasidium melanogenum]
MASSSTAPSSGDSAGNPTFQLTREEFEEHEVWQAYNGYISSLDTINWVITEASLIDPSRRLQLPIYAFLQEFKFDLHVAEDTEQPRMLVATVHTDEGPCPIWAGWSWADEGATSKEEVRGSEEVQAKMKLYLQPHADKFGPHEANIPEGYRAAFKWEEPFEVLFKLGEYEPTRTNASIQNFILLGVAKVRTRFPGLVKPPPGPEDTGPWLAMRAAFSDRPFDADKKAEQAKRKAEEARQKAEEVRQKALSEHTQMDIDSTNSVPTAPSLGNGLGLPAQLDTGTASTTPQSTEMDIDWTASWSSEQWQWLGAEDIKQEIWR